MCKFLISVIVPVYNAELYLDECVQSIINQTYKNIEVILVDDGSTDNSPQLCDSWRLKDARIKVIHKKNGGLSEARNVGIDNSCGQFVSFIDSDDIIDSRMLESMFNMHQNSRAEIVACESMRYVDGTEHVISRYHSEEEVRNIEPIEFLRGLVRITIDSSVCNKLFSREVIADHRFRVGKFNEDILFLYELIPSLNMVVMTNQGFYKYRVTEGSLTHTFSAKNLDLMYNSKELYQSICELYPMLAKEARHRMVISCQTVADSIQKASLMKSTPFSDGFKEARECIIKNVWFVIVSPLFGISEKVRILFKLILYY